MKFYKDLKYKDIKYKDIKYTYYDHIVYDKLTAIYSCPFYVEFFKNGLRHNSKNASVYYEDGEKTFHLKNDFYFSISKKDISFYNDDFFSFFKECKINKKQLSFTLCKKIWRRFCKLQVFL